ncbi:MAG: dipeptidase [Gemmatimonadota bacterium]|nr:dipeptidase [Gemmatimonadota bacterium]
MMLALARCLRRSAAPAVCLVLAATAGSADAQARQDPYLARARAILREVPLIDGHNDLPWELRERFWSSFDSLDVARRQPRVMTDIGRLRAGGVGAQFWSTYTPADARNPAPARTGMEQNDIVHRLVARYPDTFVLARTAADIERAHRDGKIASLIGLEGGHMIENSLGLLRAFYRDGVRYLTLTHSRNTDWADASTDAPIHGGLTPFGREVVREMNRLGMLVDLSHVSDSTMWDVLEVTAAPVIFSHSSSRYFAPHPRNVPDDVMRAVARNGGVIMVNFVPEFIYRPTYDWSLVRDSVRRALRAGRGDTAAGRVAWERAHPMPRPALGVVADHFEHLRQVAGADHLGLGSDFDGISETPIGLEDVSTFPALLAELLRRGWREEDVKKVAGLNVLRVMREAERVAAGLQQELGPSTARIEDLDGARR